MVFACCRIEQRIATFWYSEHFLYCFNYSHLKKNYYYFILNNCNDASIFLRTKVCYDIYFFTMHLVHDIILRVLSIFSFFLFKNKNSSVCSIIFRCMIKAMDVCTFVISRFLTLMKKKYLPAQIYFTAL